MTRKLTFLILALFTLIAGPCAKAWGQTTASVELCTSWNATLAYATAYTHDYTIDNLNGGTTTMTLGVLGVYRQSNANTYFQMNKKDGYFKNTTKLPGKITKIETTWSAAKGPTKCYFATNEEATSEDKTVTVTAATSVTYTPPTDADYYFFNIDVKTGSGSAQMTSCKVYYEGSGGDNPSITVNPSTITWDNSPINVQLSETVSVSQANLTSDITITSTIGNVSPSTITVGEDATDVILTYTPTTTGDFEGEITFTSGETTATVSVTGSAYDPSQVDTYTKVNSIADLTADDVFIIVGNNGSNYAMSNNNGTSSAPTAVAVTVTDDVITNPANTILWTISGNATDGYIFYPYGSTTTWLYCTDANNGLRVGNTTDSQDHRTFSIKDSYIFNNSRNRYLGIYSNSDWRSYTSINTNITGQTFAFYKKGGTPSTVATPTFTPAAGTYTEAQNVTIACETEGASIYYTLDGSTPTNASTLYTSAIAVSETTTVKAIAYVGNEASNVATATYTILTPLTTMDEIFDAATEADSDATDILVTFDNWVISGVKSSNAYLTDNDGKGLIIYTSSHGFEVGDILSGTAACKVQLYRGAAELTTLTSSTDGLTVSEGGSVTAQEFNINDLSGINTGAIITVNNVTYSGSNNIFTDDDENEITAYNSFMTLPLFTSGRQYNITGVYIQYDETKEIAPRTNEDIVEIASTEPSITVAETLNLPYTESEVETLEVSYENVDFEMLDLYFYDDAECTIESENDWFDADFAENGSFNIEYLASENTESTPRTVYMQIYYLYNDGESELTKVITVTQEAAPQTYNVTLSSNGVVDPQPVQGSITLSDPTNIPTGFTFAGWTESESNIQIVDNPYTPTSDVTLFAVFSREEGGIAGSGNYEKVTSNPEDWSGEYLIVYENETNAFAFDGSLQTLDATNNSISVQIENNSIESSSTTNAAKFTIEPVNGGYSIQSSSGYYIGRQAKSNGISTSKTNAFINVLTYTESTIKVTNYYASENLNNYLKYNSNNDQKRFRYFTSDSQNDIQLYKKDEGTPGVTKYYTRVFDEDTELASLTVAGPSIILCGKTLTVTGDMRNENAANLIIEDGAQLIQNSSNVMATFQKNITGYTGDNDNYYLIANPTANAVGEEDEYDALDGCTQFDLYTFDPTAEFEWVNIGQTAQKVTFDRNVGYLYANAQDMTLHFRGYLLPTNETTNINLVYYTGGEASREFPGFNLIGNPYTCNAYVNGYNFYTMADGEFVINEGSATIAPCEGFFVEATEANQSVTLSTAAPVTAPNALSLNVSQNRGNVIDRAIVRFDGSNNLHKFMMNPAHTNLSIAKGGETFAAISTEAEGELPVNFKAEKNGTYTITVNTKNVDAEYLHLIDNMTGMDVDLLSTPSYTFDSKTSDYASRFKLVFGVNNTASESSDSNFAFMSDGNLVIDNIEGEATLQIVDELGRVISTETVSGSYNKALNLKAGLYILNLNGMTQKIVVE